jgi:hypothetical protein
MVSSAKEHFKPKTKEFAGTKIKGKIGVEKHKTGSFVCVADPQNLSDYLRNFNNITNKTLRWRDATWVVTAFNKNRKSKVAPGWLLCVDESMIAWTGNGCPHLSFMPRKPEPLDIEIKNLCDATSGLMLFLEIQDNKGMMARKKHRDGFPAAIAATLRLLECLSASRVPSNLRVERLCAMDSWFASVACTKALWNLLKMRSTGNIKTATRCHPLQEMRWKLSTQQRGAIDIMECEDHKTWALGWHDQFCKTFVYNAGSSDLGEPAKKKRQRDDGSNFCKCVNRPEAL